MSVVTRMTTQTVRTPDGDRQPLLPGVKLADHAIADPFSTGTSFVTVSGNSNGTTLKLYNQVEYERYINTEAMKSMCEGKSPKERLAILKRFRRNGF